MSFELDLPWGAQRAAADTVAACVIKVTQGQNKNKHSNTTAYKS